MKRAWLLSLVIIALACAEDPKSPDNDLAPRPPLPLDRAAIMAHLTQLANDSMRGRGSGTVDELHAAQYIMQQFQSLGLSPVAGSYQMPFPIAPALVGGRTGVTSQNVVGVIRGAGGLENQWVVLGAHYDHVGIRPVTPDSSAIFNGADDNASGTALLLQIAKHVKSYSDHDGFGGRPRRSLLFIAFGAEELGLLGSEQYCARPAYPLTTVAAMLNFDMVGAMRDHAVKIGGMPTAVEWPALLTEHNADQLTIWTVACENCTDFACFRRNQRPALWFFTGLHENYHQPSDDSDIINSEGIGQVGDLAVRLTIDLMVRPRAPTFTQ